ncbi:MAG: serine/threonine-protein kinase [Planctomycetota bacterium]
MTDSRRRQAEELFHKAADLPPAERAAYLERHCPDAEMRADVVSLLECLSDAAAASLDAAGASEAADLDLVGRSIGPYRVLELLGEGGFGSVYRAEQAAPIRREVAVKVIKLGMDTKRVIERFELERETLAMMDHPSIAKVLDAGATESGRPYFVMELVRGVPITEYCDAARLPLRDRLELFTQGCHAVQHAHQKGIIHRDIKPSNVLVTLQDDTPVPKVIDFGIAKATGKREAETKLLTDYHFLIGTPEYMSPEQAGGGPFDVDTRTDIYSLGVLLYVLVAGTTPFDQETLRRAGYRDIQRIIREMPLPTPSQRASRLGPELETAASARRLAPQHLSKILRGDLDWIIMKALEKDRDRRYATAIDLATDIRRHLNDDPVEAGPPSAFYRIGKFVRRHRVGVLATTLAAAAVLAGLSLAAYGFVQATRAKTELKDQRDAAERARQGETAQREVAENHAVTAQREASRFAAANDYLQGMLAAVDPGNVQGNDVTVRFVLDEAARKLQEGSLADQPEVEASVRITIGQTYESLGLYEEAAVQLSRAEAVRREHLGAEHRNTLHARSLLGVLHHRQGDYVTSERLLRETLEAQRRTLGEDDPETLFTMDGLAVALWRQGRNGEAELLHRQALERQRRVLGDEHP